MTFGYSKAGRTGIHMDNRIKHSQPPTTLPKNILKTRIHPQIASPNDDQVQILTPQIHGPHTYDQAHASVLFLRVWICRREKTYSIARISHIHRRPLVSLIMGRVSVIDLQPINNVWYITRNRSQVDTTKIARRHNRSASFSQSREYLYAPCLIQQLCRALIRW